MKKIDALDGKSDGTITEAGWHIFAMIHDSDTEQLRRFYNAIEKVARVRPGEGVSSEELVMFLNQAAVVQDDEEVTKDGMIQ